ncbi:MAG: ferrochelatase [Burkholderiales bacterium]
MSPEPIYPHGAINNIGVLLINLGTPDEPTPSATRRYLREFLSDPRVVEIPPIVWWPILHGVILRTRPAKSAARYAQIWTKDGSPLRVITQRQALLLQGYLGERTNSAPIVVEVGMRYGNPSIAAGLAKLRAQFCDRILLLPLYPQYAASTTATGFDRVFDELKVWRNQPAIRTVRHYHDHPGYIAALAQNIRDYWNKNGRGEKLVMSFHGVPRFSLDKGDPYHCECRKTGRLLAEALHLKKDDYIVTFQSRFGKAKWLEPYTAPMLEKLGKAGVKRIDITCPGFTADCLETLEEIALEARATFLSAGGKDYHFIPCLNERDTWIRALMVITLENLQGWLPAPWDAVKAKQDADRSLALATEMGAQR